MEYYYMTIFYSIIAAIVASIVISAFRVLREYTRGVVFLLGRFYKVKGPGLIILIPGVQTMTKIPIGSAGAAGGVSR